MNRGVYKNNTHDAYSPAFTIIRNGVTYDSLNGEFEILEIEYDGEMNIESFAANFTQQYQPDTPSICGTFRYNSSVPLEPRFEEFYVKKIALDISVYPWNGNPWYPNFRDEGRLIIRSRDNFLKIQPLASGGEGVEVSIDDESMLIKFVFAAPIGEELSEKKYKNAQVYLYPFHDPERPAMAFASHPDRHLRVGTDDLTEPVICEFEVVKLIRGDDGEITTLVINFNVQGSQGDFIKGSISKFPKRI